MTNAMPEGEDFLSICTKRGLALSCEALIAVDSGQPLDDVLEDYARIPSSFYRIVGASSFARILRVIKRSSK